MIPLVDLKRQYRILQPEIDEAVKKVLKDGNFILGEQLGEFEKEFARYCGVDYCVGVGSGTDAILMALRALGIGPGDEVITTANTFISTVFPIIDLGARPILVDVDPETYQIDPNELEKAITHKTKMIIPVHLFGIPAPMERLADIANTHKLFMVEDACQAHGASFQEKKCGSFGQAAAFSFYPGKNIGAGGDGGAIVTNDKRLANKIRAMRDLGQFKKYDHRIFGYNSRLDTIQAVILSIKLKFLDKWNKERRQLAELYNKLLDDLPVVLPPKLSRDYYENYYVYVVRTPHRDALLEFLKDKGIFCGIHYPIPIHLQRSMKELGYKKGDFPITEAHAKEILSLPMFPGLKEEEVRKISDFIHQFFRRLSGMQFEKEFAIMHNTVAKLRSSTSVGEFFEKFLAPVQHEMLARKVTETDQMQSRSRRSRKNRPTVGLVVK